MEGTWLVTDKKPALWNRTTQHEESAREKHGIQTFEEMSVILSEAKDLARRTLRS